ncbi:BTB/POZ domain-containing protein KCTD1-like [Ptychodera flava]|uniref:BTB/POZ domain-containing protein KCTD1-like n=1 Tax=Ptychodera flava TaxID=63121 RepID=UPI003969EC55
MEDKPKTTVSDMVRLDVGGKVYTTSLTTLTRYPDSMLGAMFSGRFPVQTGHDGTCLIDRDGKLFRYVLNFLRTSKLNLPENFREYDQLMDEAEFYQIVELQMAISEWRQQRESAKHSIRKPEEVDYVEFCADGEDLVLFAKRKVVESLPSVMKHMNYMHDMAVGLPEWSDDARYMDGYEFIDEETVRLHLDSAFMHYDEGPVEFSRFRLFRDLEKIGFTLVSTASDQGPIDKRGRWTFRKGSAKDVHELVQALRNTDNVNIKS